jgi:hypothetical protein
MLTLGFWSSISTCFAEIITYPHRSFSEVSLRVSDKLINPYTDVKFEVVFERPDFSKVVVDGFYDGEDIFKAGAYCDMIGGGGGVLLPILRVRKTKAGNLKS